MKLSHAVCIILAGIILWLVQGAVSQPPIPRETVYGIPQGNWKTGIQLQETKCQQFVQDHHWTQSLLMMPVTNMASATNVNAATWYPVVYCTNCGVLRIEVK